MTYIIVDNLATDSVITPIIASLMKVCICWGLLRRPCTQEDDTAHMMVSTLSSLVKYHALHDGIKKRRISNTIVLSFRRGSIRLE